MIITDQEAKSLTFNRKYFYFLEWLILRISLPMAKRILAKRAIKLAVWSSTGRYSSPTIESVFLEQAELLKSSCYDDYEENSTLHILTECYGVGGHSKVVERWISLSGRNEKHSVLFINQKSNDIPDVFFKLSTGRNGDVFSLGCSSDDVYKAKNLREIASSYEKIILHTHMNDVVPLIAFGTTKFKRPVLLYNHADHLFWLGVSIADRVAETRSWGQTFSRDRRGIRNSIVLSIPPTKESETESGIMETQTELAPLNILTVGTSHKFTKLDNDNFPNYMQILMHKFSNLTFTIVGPEISDFGQLINGLSQFTDRARFLGCIPNEELKLKMREADLIIDSFPMSGGTALGEAISLGKPVLACRSVTGHLDYMYESESYCESFDELLRKTERAITDSRYRGLLASNVGGLYRDSENPDRWRSRLAEVYASLPTEHHIYKRPEPCTIEFSDLDKFLLLSNERRKTLFQLGKVLRLFYYRKRGCLRFGVQFLL